ncbi:hypothetical protein [Hoeflea prorocentri]|uniref:Uncharacterized protein n=1 Tax=Hoeflea prorocentri TaxID=1922333 RepID=A0A9X3UMM8_9HYPH|nr:hypothetical protein [Hoeflea prorocentri]MCY6383351.1 hypothetical protein [Hoeflea prorocentri]MDA5401151.1 hypothetical protein [Hoeflea prorocentri]
MPRKLVEFAHEIGNILYVGGILSHIVIGVLFANAAPDTMVTVYTYKLQSAYILILPGLTLKILCDLVLFFFCRERAWWMRIKFLAAAVLATNAFVFLVPMMPELLALAEASVPSGHLNPEFVTLEHKEMFIGQLNVIPLLVELTMGAFKPPISGSERRAARAASL